MRLLVRASLLNLARQRLQCALAVTGIALGVAVVTAMHVVEDSARRAFDAALGATIGRATDQVLGHDGPFDERVLATVRRVAPSAWPQPVVAGGVTHGAGDAARVLHLIGIDVYSTPPAVAGRGFDARALVLEPGAVVLTAATAAALGVGRDASFTVRVQGRNVSLHVVEVLRADSGVQLADDMLLTDIATAQETLHLAGRLTRIDLEFGDDAAGRRTRAALAAALPPAVAVVDAARRRNGAREMTRAFYTNLDALGLLALLVGGFMVYNTMSFLVLQRTRLFGRLRALGVARGTLAALVAGEALALGLVGGLGGIALGRGLAGALLAPLTRTLQDHYFDAGVAAVRLGPRVVALALLLALAVALAAALGPAWRAASLAPGDVAARGLDARAAPRRARRAAGAALACAAGGTLLLLLAPRDLVAGFVALGALMLAAMLAAPGLVATTLSLAARAAGHASLMVRLALRSAAGALDSIGLAVAALMAATATSIGVGLMVASFRVAVIDWLDQFLRADLYVTAAAAQDETPPFAATLATQLEALPGVAALSAIRRVNLERDARPLRLVAYALPAAARGAFQFVDGAAPAALWRTWEERDLAIVSEPYAFRHGVGRGDWLELPGPRGALRFRIAGVYRDYGSEQGAVAISLARYRAHWNDGRLSGIGLYATAGVNVDDLARAVRARLPADDSLEAWSNTAVKRRSLAIFDRTFAITDVLTVLAATIAALGVVNALLALHLGRAREYALLRACGCGAGQLRGVLYLQSLLIGCLAALAAVPLGVGIALLLIEVINVRAFGWTMALAWQDNAVWRPALVAVLAALAATVYPAERALAVDTSVLADE